MQRLIKLIDSDDDRVAMMASTAVLDRAMGKPQPTNGENNLLAGGITIQILRYDDGQTAEQLEPPTISIEPVEVS